MKVFIQEYIKLTDNIIQTHERYCAKLEWLVANDQVNERLHRTFTGYVLALNENIKKLADLQSDSFPTNEQKAQLMEQEKNLRSIQYKYRTLLKGVELT